MTAKELKDLMHRIKFNIPSLAQSLGEKADSVPYETVRNYIYGVNAIPEHIATAAIALEKRLKEQDLQRGADTERILNEQFPRGIMSEVLV